MTTILNVDNLRTVNETLRCIAVVYVDDLRHACVVVVTPPTDDVLIDVVVERDGELQIETHKLHRWNVNGGQYVIYKDGEPVAGDVEAAMHLMKRAEEAPVQPAPVKLSALTPKVGDRIRYPGWAPHLRVREIVAIDDHNVRWKWPGKSRVFIKHRPGWSHECLKHRAVNEGAANG